MATDTLTFTDSRGDTYALTLTVSGDTGAGTVTAITGTAVGEPVTGINDSFEGPDNVVSTTSPYVDGEGLAFQTAESLFKLSFDGESDNLTYYSDGIGGDLSVSDLSFDVSCFFPGTLIATPSGQVPVDQLGIGDSVTTSDGRTAPVRWIGRNTVSTRFAEPLRVLPIRIKADAFAESQPSRDLLVSPEHAVLVGDILIQAGALVNGTSIIRERHVPETFIYYHIELADHSLILAEGTPVETFVDYAGRMAFDNWAEHEALYGAAPIVEMPYPRAQSHRQVPPGIRAALARRAARVLPGAPAAAA